MTKQEAIGRLRAYERIYCDVPRVILANYDFRYRSYAKTLIPFLIQRITNAQTKDPIEILHDFRSEMDYMIGETDNSRTWAFCSITMQIVQELIDYIE